MGSILFSSNYIRAVIHGSIYIYMHVFLTSGSVELCFQCSMLYNQFIVVVCISIRVIISVSVEFS